MPELKQYVCVNCGKPAAALYKIYGPSVLKLNKCKSCKGVVDKYIEYDNVIIMIDTVLISKEAQRHIIYNIDFQSYWKLLTVLILLETYGVWRNDSLLNIGVNTFCNLNTNSNHSTTTYIPVPMSAALPDWCLQYCNGWSNEDREELSRDHFIWEKDFYIQFTSTVSGILAFICTVHFMMQLIRPLLLLKRDVSVKRMLKAFCIAYVSILFTLPMLVWGNAETSAEARTIHYVLVFAYSFVVFFSSFTVLYNTPIIVTLFTLILGNIAKYMTMFFVTPFLRSLSILQ